MGHLMHAVTSNVMLSKKAFYGYSNMTLDLKTINNIYYSYLTFVCSVLCTVAAPPLLTHLFE